MGYMGRESRCPPHGDVTGSPSCCCCFCCILENMQQIHKQTWGRKAVTTVYVCVCVYKYRQGSFVCPSAGRMSHARGTTWRMRVLCCASKFDTFECTTWTGLPTGLVRWLLFVVVVVATVAVAESHFLPNETCKRKGH